MFNAMQGGVLPMGKCVPSNDTLSGSMAEPFTAIIGAANGLMPYIVTGVAVIMTIAILLTLKSDKASGLMKVVAKVLLAPIALWFGLMLYFILSGALVQVDACPF